MSNIYDILGKLKNVIGLDDKPTETKTETVYESVEPRGSITEAVKGLESKYATFKEAKAKPDFLDVDKDGDKAEPFKKAVKDKKSVEEGAGPYTLDDPKHPKFKANYEKYKKAHPDCTLAEFVAAMRKKEKGLSEAAYDEPAAPDADAIAKRKRLQAIKDRQEDERAAGGKDSTNTPIRKVAGKAYGGAAQKDDDLDEVAPPGAKAERMVKHIKKGYAKDGKLSKKEKGIAYATAWKAHNKGQVEEGVEFKDAGKIKNSAPNMKKAKPAMVKESRMIQEGDYYYESIGKALAEKNPNLDTASPDFYAAVRQEMVAQGMKPNQARNILAIDEDFIMDVASSYGHYCKEIAEAHAPMNSFLGGAEELDEIARLAGLPAKKELDENPAIAAIGADLMAAAPAIAAVSAMKDEQGIEEEEELDEREQFQSMPQGYASGTPKAPAVNPNFKPTYDKSKLNPMSEEEVEEGNEYTKARLDAIQAGKDTFTVGGKVHKVTGDTAQEVSMKESTSLNDIRKLSGLAEAEEAEENEDEELAEERDIEWDNTPEEEVAPLGAAIPSGTDLHKSKRQDPKTANKAANPLKEKELEESLWKSYEDMIKDIKE